jgi:hypothetical protein
MNGGTLTVSANWQADGAFTAPGGMVVFNSALDKPMDVQMSSGSYFNHVQIGDGTATPWVQLKSNLSVHGNLTLNVGSLFQTGSNTLTLTGNWQDNGAGFDYAHSAVVFNGSGQTANAVSSAVIFNQDFSEFNSVTPLTSDEPAGWSNALGASNADPFGFWYFGDSGSGGQALRDSFLSSDKVDAWLFTPLVNLSTGVNYRTQFDYKPYDPVPVDPSNFSAWSGSGQLPSQMTAIVTVNDANNTTWNTANQAFTVSSSRAYNLGLRNDAAAAFAAPGGGASLDNIILTIEPVIPPNFGQARIEIYLPIVIRQV